MIDIDELEKLCKYEINRGTANPYTVNENPIHAMQELITRLRQAEKDAARYQCIKSIARVIECEEFEMDMLDGQDLDAMVDECIEAMQCK